MNNFVFLKGVRVVPNQFADVAGSVRVHFGVSATILDMLTSLNKRHHERRKTTPVMNVSSQVGQKNERLGSFYFAGRLKMMVE